MIVRRDFDEQELFKVSKDFLKDTYGRRLADFEEESILKELIINANDIKSFRVYVFYTPEDFESELFVENDVMEWNVRERLQ